MNPPDGPDGRPRDEHPFPIPGSIGRPSGFEPGLERGSRKEKPRSFSSPEPPLPPSLWALERHQDERAALAIVPDR